MELKSPPKLTVTTGRVPGSSSTDSRTAVFLKVDYKYECTDAEIDFIEDKHLIILEEVTIKGFDPADPGNDIDLVFSIRPQFTARPPDKADAVFLRANSKTVTRSRTLFVLQKELSDALNVNDLKLNSVKANVQLTYAHIGESDPVPVDLD